MNHDSVEFTTLKKVTATILGMDVNEIEPEMNFFTDLGADSLDLYQIVMGIEDELNISISAESLEGLQTVQEALKLIESLTDWFIM